MKVSTLIALLKTYPQDADVSLLGVSHFYIYYYQDFQKDLKTILLDTELLDDSDIETSDNISLIKILDSKRINTTFEVNQSNKSDLDDDVKMHKSILKGLEDSDK
jgi:hypothetical protein